MSGGFTPGPWFVGVQNDALFVIAGRPPALNNDHPWHDAPRVALAKVYGPTKGDCLPVDADANARLIAAAPALFEQLTFAVKLLSAFPALSGSAQVEAMRATLSAAVPSEVR